MIELKQISKSKCYEGDQFVFSHHSEVCNCDMTFGIYIPVHETKEKLRLIWFLSGLTCTHENAMVKSGIQRWASEEKIAAVNNSQIMNVLMRQDVPFWNAVPFSQSQSSS